MHLVLQDVVRGAPESFCGLVRILISKFFVSRQWISISVESAAPLRNECFPVASLTNTTASNNKVTKNNIVIGSSEIKSS